MRYQGFSQPTGDVEELESSFYVEKDNSNPAFYLDCSDLPSSTRQEFAKECDINTIMAQYEKTGVVSHVNRNAPAYLDLSDVPDLQRAMTILADAQAAFMSLPATVRREFDNDPTKFVDYASDPANLDRMREWGLAEPLPTPPEPSEVRVVSMPDSSPAK